MSLAEDTLRLDARQRAMLEEMGVRHWWPMPEVAASRALNAPEKRAFNPDSTRAAAVFDAQTQAGTAVAPGVRPPMPDNDPARPAAHAAVPAASAPSAAAGTVTLLCDRAQPLFHSTPGAPGGWLILADLPPAADGRYGAPLDGEAGRLLHAMLRALRLERGPAPVHLVRLHRGVSSADGGAQPLPPEGWAPQLAALAPRIVLALGPLAAQSLAGSDAPLGRLRGRVGRLATLADTPWVASYPPAYLLRNPADKAKAWADLCLAAQAAG